MLFPAATLVPFSVNFLSDNFEVQMEADPANTYASRSTAFSNNANYIFDAYNFIYFYFGPRRGQAGNQGFALVYVMDAIGCNAAAMNN